MGTKHENYTTLTPYRSTNVPLLMIDGTAPLTESPAIMTYLCESSDHRNKLYDVPQGSIQKAKVDSYLHWHHDNTRYLSKLFQTKVRPDLKVELGDEENQRIQDLLTNLNHGWLNDGGGNFIGGNGTPTIADILAYGEISTVTMTNLLELGDDNGNLKEWANRMEELPYHAETHAALQELGNLNEPTETIPKLLGKATKIGLKSLADAQQSNAAKT